jgi:hypothetical protein
MVVSWAQSAIGLVRAKVDSVGVVLSREVLFQCGSKIINASKLFTAVGDIYKRRPFHSISVQTGHISLCFLSYLDTLSKIRKTFQGSKKRSGFDLLQILVKALVQTATESKDAMFALFGVLQKMDFGIPPPDYSKSMEDIYTEIAKFVILNDDSLQILERTAQHDTLSSLPSWVPNCRWDARHLSP